MYIIFDSHHKQNQSVILNTLNSYPRRRDYFNYNLTSKTGPILRIFNIVASILNVTLVSKQSLKDLKLDETKYPRVIPGMYISERYEDTINYFRNVAQEKPYFIPPYTVAYNFAYCHIPRNKQESVMNFSVFTNSFDIWTWLTTLFLGYLMCLILGHGKIRNTWLSIFATLLAYAPCNKRLKYSYLLILWMFISLIIVNIYSGSITSKLIIPPPDDKIDTVLDLSARNYRLVFNKNHGIKRFKDFVKSQGNRTKYTKVLNHLAKTAVEVEDLNLNLATKHNVATMRSWRNSVTAALEASEILKLNKKLSRRKCYVGKEVLDSSRQYYYGFYPPNSLKVAKAFQTVLEVGLYAYWYEELHGLLIADRVQDRVKVKGSQLTTDNGDSTPQALEIEGNIIKIFCLWSICVVVCITVFIYEQIVLRLNTIC